MENLMSMLWRAVSTKVETSPHPDIPHQAPRSNDGITILTGSETCFQWIWDLQLECDRRGILEFLYDCNLQYERSPELADFFPSLRNTIRFTQGSQPNQPLLFLEVRTDAFLAGAACALKYGFAMGSKEDNDFNEFPHSYRIGARAVANLVEHPAGGEISKMLFKQHSSLHKTSQEVMALIKGSVHTGLRSYLADCTSPLLAISFMAKVFLHIDHSQKMTRIKEEELLRFRETNMSLSDYLAEVSNLTAQMMALGSGMSPSDIIAMTVAGLPRHYHYVHCNPYLLAMLQKSSSFFEFEHIIRNYTGPGATSSSSSTTI